MTVMLGAIINLILDPVFIYGLHMGVYGAAIATVISQGVSFMWVLSFFMGKKTFYHIKKENLILKAGMVGKITSLGISGFVMQGTNCLVQVVCNKMLFMYGGDMYVGIMTVINSVREILSVPGSTLGSGAQPVLGYNYGAKQGYDSFRRTCVKAVFFWILFYVIPIRGTVDIYSTWLCKEGGIFLDIQESNYSCSTYNYSSYAWTWS